MLLRSLKAHLLIWAVAFGILGGNAIAQNVTGTLTGTVADPSGAVVPGATVLMKNTASGDERRTVTNNDGFFSINAVQPGDYTVTIKAQGFEAYAQEVYTSMPATSATCRT
jgi:hypothetical protein